ncbi:ribose-5-phosphate isomerase A [Mycobacterium kyorinense]|uniref:ribose-5-phosphate isomerase n=1 Tax=Mycobacterium kyorinense TaxID=487514 RepID=A0A1X1XYY1_9MYCO|nr:ribose-5-phosphate isomerase A [Mycobacterium kyorinense]ORW04029.1 hypothetical protein AWC14_04550 [Mycobacterium kyorinense]
MSIEQEKQFAAEAAADLVEDGMTVGLGTGSTVAFLLPALARRSLDIRCVATSSRTAQATCELGLKVVNELHGPIPLELFRFGLGATLRRVAPVSLRNAPPSPDGGVIADYRGPVADPAALASWLAATPGVVEHGLFPPEMVTSALVGRDKSVDSIDFELTRPGMRSGRTGQLGKVGS